MSAPRRCAKCGATLSASFPCGYCGSSYRTGDRPALTPSETAGPLDSPNSLSDELAALRARDGVRLNDPRAVSPSPAVGPTQQQSTDQGWTKNPLPAVAGSTASTTDPDESSAPVTESQRREWAFTLARLAHWLLDSHGVTKASASRQLRELAWRVNGGAWSDAEMHQILESAARKRPERAVAIAVDPAERSEADSRSTPQAVAVPALTVRSPRAGNGP